MPRFFTLELAEKMLPEAEKLLRGCLALKAEHERCLKYLHELTQRILMLGGMQVRGAETAHVRVRRDSSIAELQAKIEKITEIGCVIKDLDIGLIDFPALYMDQEVYLCWKLGEPSIKYWHGVDEGFRGRKEIRRGTDLFKAL